jgi:hypothetical protein
MLIDCLSFMSYILYGAHIDVVQLNTVVGLGPSRKNVLGPEQSETN